MTGEPHIACVIGGGPAGLMAAEVLSAAGTRVVLAEGRPTVGRKFLMAGKSGLNLTRQADAAGLVAATAPWLEPALRAFDADAVQDWARGLGQEVFTGTSGRVFPVAMKASPLLRAWLARLAAQGVQVRTRWRWTGWQGDALAFATPDGPVTLSAGVTLLALGGASWARLGSDGTWAPVLADRGVPLAPFRPANMGFDVAWSPHMAPHSGQPVKAVALILGERRVEGEFVLTRNGIEGGAVYALSAAIRDRMGPEGVAIRLDLAPDLAADRLAARLAAQLAGRPGDSLSNRLRKAGLTAIKAALLREGGGPLPSDPAMLAARIKDSPLRLVRPRPMDEAISTAGGIRAEGLDPHLMLRALPGVFAAGEMLDWEAPTGGYLLTACLATGRLAGHGALDWLRKLRNQSSH
jgi:uncharacterized flavoprotein (TIGR03862 family)